jgi:hypothetical protein
MLRQNMVPQATATSGEMSRGDDLYVKWRIKATGQVLEETVDLRSRLPADIVDHKVYFDIEGPQLYVYLITPLRRDAGTPPNGPRMYWHMKTLTLYPDTAKR